MHTLMDLLTTSASLDAEDTEVAHRARVATEATFIPFAAVLPGRSPRRHAEMAARLRRRGGALAVTESERVVGLAERPLHVSHLGEGIDVLLVVGVPSSPAELAAAHNDVMILLDDASRRGVRGRVAVEDHLLELLTLRSPRTTAQLREEILGPLTDPRHEDLLQTLRALFARRMNYGATCAALYIHRNTLAYRLRRITEVAGIDLHDPRDVARIYLALAAGE